MVSKVYILIKKVRIDLNGIFYKNNGIFDGLRNTWMKHMIKIATYDKSFEDDLKNRDNSLNSIPSSIYPDRQFDGISFSTLHELRKSNPFRVVIGHIDLNSIRNKFEPLK